MSTTDGMQKPSKVDGAGTPGTGPRKLAVPTDTLFSNQWHLLNTGQSGGTAGIDLNVVGVWDDYKGLGINVAVIDDGFDYNNPDLLPNYNQAGDFDFGQNDSDSAPVNVDDDHGTATMGLIGADDNGTGTVGVASDATLLGYRVDFNATLANFLTQLTDAIARAELNADVANMSLGIGDYGAQASAVTAALVSGAANGRGGLGTNYVVAGGNARASSAAASSDVNADSLSNDRHTISVAAINDDGSLSSYSTPGAPTLVSAFGSPGEIWTTDRVGTAGYDATDYTGTFNGTSAAAPQVAGVVALILEANPDLGWRDVQDILSYSAVHTGTTIGSGTTGAEFYDWGFNGATNWNGGGMHFSGDYGFGLVDALAAVRLAETWTGQQTSANEISATGNNPNNFVIPDNTPAGVSFTIDLAADIEIDALELLLNLTHTYVADLIVRITSPLGTISTLLDTTGPAAAADSNWIYTSNAFRGEASQGTWTVFVSDNFALDTGAITDSTLTAFGSAFAIDDVYVFTNEFSDYAGVFSHSTVITDTDNGIDTLNVSAVTSGTTADLVFGTGTIDNVAVTISNIENIYGGDGAENLFGSNVANIFTGGRGDDSLLGRNGNDTLSGDAGNDILYGVGDDDLLDGGDGNDTVSGGAGNDSVAGNAGDDLVFGGAGIDTLDGGAGNDTLSSGSDDDPIVSGGAGFDLVLGAGGNDTLTGDADNDTLSGGGGNDSADGGADNDEVFGAAGNDTVSGGAGDDTISGGTGDDIVFGNAGIDQLIGAAGNDTLDGGTGADVLTGGAGLDVIIFADGYGADQALGFEDNIDTLQLNSDLWLATNGVLTATEVVNTFAVQTSPGIIDFDFGTGDTLRIVQGSGIAAGDLIDDILIV